MFVLHVEGRNINFITENWVVYVFTNKQYKNNSGITYVKSMVYNDEDSYIPSFCIPDQLKINRYAAFLGTAFFFLGYDPLKLHFNPRLFPHPSSSWSVTELLENTNCSTQGSPGCR